MEKRERDERRTAQTTLCLLFQQEINKKTRYDVNERDVPEWEWTVSGNGRE